MVGVHLYPVPLKKLVFEQGRAEIICRWNSGRTDAPLLLPLLHLAKKSPFLVLADGKS